MSLNHGMVSVNGGQLVAWAMALMWPFLRIVGVFTAAPLWGGRNTPWRLRMGLAAVLAWFIQPLIPPMPSVDPLSLAALLIALQQVVIGLAMGFILQMVFAAFSIAGENISLGMGLGFAELADPQTGVQSPVLGQYYGILVMLLFLGLNGHLILINLLVKSFTSLPVGLHGMAGKDLWTLVSWGGQMYVAAVLVALPAIASLLLVNISFGVITRASPQLNIFAVGFPMTILVGFVVVMFTLPALTSHVQNLLGGAFALIKGISGG